MSSTTRNPNEFSSNLNSFSNGGYSDDHDDYDEMDHDDDEIEDSEDEIEEKTNNVSFDSNKNCLQTITNGPKANSKSTKANKIKFTTDKTKPKVNNLCSTTEDNYELSANNQNPAVNQYNFSAQMYQPIQQAELSQAASSSFGYTANSTTSPSFAHQYPSFDGATSNSYAPNQFYQTNSSHYAGYQQPFSQAAQSSQFSQGYGSSYVNDYSGHHYYPSTFNSNNDYLNSKQIITSSPLPAAASSTPSSTSLLVANVLSQFQSI